MLRAMERLHMSDICGILMVSQVSSRSAPTDSFGMWAWVVATGDRVTVLISFHRSLRSTEVIERQLGQRISYILVVGS